MKILKRLAQPLLRQYRIDDGKLGGFYVIVLQSLGLIGLLTFINTFINAYQTFYSRYLTVFQILLIVLLIAAITLWFMHAILFPSMVQFNNRQSYTLHQSPMQRDIAEIKTILKQLQEERK